MRTRALLPFLVALGFLAAPAAAHAGDEWEQLIVDGIRRQDERLREIGRAHV